MVFSLVTQRGVLLFILAYGQVWRAVNVMCNLGNWGSSEVAQGPCRQPSSKFGLDDGFVPAQVTLQDAQAPGTGQHPPGAVFSAETLPSTWDPPGWGWQTIAGLERIQPSGALPLPAACPGRVRGDSSLCIRKHCFSAWEEGL